MNYPTFLSQKKVFNSIVDPYFDDLFERAFLNSTPNKEELKRELKAMCVKKTHSYDMAIDGLQVAKNLGVFSRELILVQQTEGFLHDIGRFEQMYNTHTFVDKESFCPNGIYNYRYCIKDHGELGRVILLNDDKISLFFTENNRYNELIGDVVGQHFSRHNHYRIDPKCNTFRNYSVSELRNNSEQMDILKSWQVQIVQDTDRLDILKQVDRGDFIPNLQVSPVKPISKEALGKFYNCEYINIVDFRNRGLWTENTGQLIRWSFVYQTSLVSTLKRMKELGLLERAWIKQPIPELQDAFEFTIALRDAMINCSEDGIYLDKDRAKQLIKG